MHIRILVTMLNWNAQWIPSLEWMIAWGDCNIFTNVHKRMMQVKMPKDKFRKNYLSQSSDIGLAMNCSVLLVFGSWKCEESIAHFHLFPTITAWNEITSLNLFPPRHMNEIFYILNIFFHFPPHFSRSFTYKAEFMSHLNFTASFFMHRFSNEQKIGKKNNWKQKICHVTSKWYHLHKQSRHFYLPSSVLLSCTKTWHNFTQNKRRL